MANVIPGYDFGVTEEVTAANLLKWLVGGMLDSQIEIAGLEAGTGFSLSGMTNEGDLEINFSTGKVYVKTRWGQVPLMGGGFFTKRCAMYESDYGGGAYNQTAFYDHWKIGIHGADQTHLTLTSADLMGPGIGPDNAWMWAGYITMPGGYNTVSGWATVWPCAELDDPNYDRSMPTSHTSIHPVLCMMGFTPIHASISSEYTGCWPLTRRFRDMGSQQEQPPYGMASFMGLAANWTMASSGTTLLHWGYVWPSIGTASSRGYAAEYNMRL